MSNYRFVFNTLEPHYNTDWPSTVFQPNLCYKQSCYNEVTVYRLYDFVEANLTLNQTENSMSLI